MKPRLITCESSLQQGFHQPHKGFGHGDMVDEGHGPPTFLLPFFPGGFLLSCRMRKR